MTTLECDDGNCINRMEKRERERGAGNNMGCDRLIGGRTEEYRMKLGQRFAVSRKERKEVEEMFQYRVSFVSCHHHF